MVNQDSFTPQEYAKMVGMFPDPPQNPLPTGGYMDAGFDWVVHQAEEFVGDFNRATMNEDYWLACPNSVYSGGNNKNCKEVIRGGGYGYVCENCGEEFHETAELDAFKMAETFSAEGGNSTYEYVMGMIEDLSDDDYMDFCYEMDIDSEDMEELSSFVMRNYDSNRVMRFLKDRGMVEGYQAENFCADCKSAEGCGCGGKGAETFEAEGKKVKSVIETAMKEYDEYVADKEAYDDDDIISFEEWFDWHLGDDELEGDEETLEYLKTLPPYNSPESNDWIWEMYHGAENFEAEGKKLLVRYEVMTTTKGKKEANELGDKIFDYVEDTLGFDCAMEIINGETDELIEDYDAETFGAEVVPISDEEELLVVRNDMGHTKGFIEMEEDLEDDSIEIEISDDEMEEIAEITLDTEFIKPSRDWFSLALGTAAVVIGGSLFLQNRGVFKADGDETEDSPSLVAHPSTGDLLPADYEEMVVESTGYAVPVIPVSLDPAFMGSRFHALPTDRVVESNEPGIGAHTDVAMTRDTNYREPEQTMVTEPPFAYKFNAENGCKCSILDKIKSFFTGKSCCEVKEANSVTGQTPYFGVGFEPKNPQTRVIKETRPISLDPSTAPYLPTNLSGYTGQSYTPPSVYSDMMQIGMTGQTPSFVSSQSSIGENRAGSRSVATSDSLQSVHGNLSAGVNQSYTDGSKTMSLSQWSIEYDVSQISDSEAFAVSRSSGERTMIRRV